MSSLISVTQTDRRVPFITKGQIDVNSDPVSRSVVSGVAVLAVLLVVVAVVVLWVPALAGAQACPNAQFRGGSSAHLPDCRGYELVSPPEKAGGHVAAVTGRTEAAADGSALAFISTTAFGEVRGTGVESEYMAQRSGAAGTPGWSTHGLIPKQDPLLLVAVPAGMSPGYRGLFSPDLSTGVFQAWSPLTDDPDVALVRNLYVGRDLRSPGQESYSLVTACPACGDIPLVPPNIRGARQVVAGASEDFEQVLFESELDLTGDGEGVIKAYVSDGGVVRLVGKVPPDGGGACGAGGPECVVPTEGGGASIAGLGASAPMLTPNVISDDGSRVNFTAPVAQDIVALDSSNLYQADSHGTVSTADDTTVRINVSERTEADNAAAAVYETASADGSRVFFKSRQALTNDALVGPDHLYMWQRDSLPGGGHLTLIDRDEEPSDSPAGVQGVIGASDDGTYVYFVAESQLVADAPALDSMQRGIYLWHEGEITYIGAFTLDTGRGDHTDNLLDGNSLGLKYVRFALHSRVSADGKAMSFTATNGAGLTGFDHNTTGCGDGGSQGCLGYYVYRAEQDSLACATCNPDGTRPTSDIAFQLAVTATWSVSAPYPNRRLSEDGRRVFFSSREKLVVEDINGRYDAYQYDAVTGRISLLSSGKSSSDAYFMDASASGDDVFIWTRERLVGWDVDDAFDFYDARVGGGVAEPVAAAGECVGASCRGPLATPPGATAASSAVAVGSGNVTGARGRSDRARRGAGRAKRCRAGRVRYRVRGRARCLTRKQVRRAKQRAARRAAGVRGSR
jgi:hypothetical protein